MQIFLFYLGKLKKSQTKKVRPLPEPIIKTNPKLIKHTTGLSGLSVIF